MNKINLDEFNMSDAELFAPVNHDEFESERITAPRYSYWKSVFRVFFRKKINIVVLSILAILILFSYVYPAIIHYDADVNPYITSRPRRGSGSRCPSASARVEKILKRGLSEA